MSKKQAPRRLAETDPLTGLLNRRAFLDKAIGREGEQVLQIADLDHFKSVNDTHGHAGGDAVLREVGKTVGGLLRTEDVFARYGGEEFVVLARGLSLKQGGKLAERIRIAVQDRIFVHEGRRLRVTVSLGVAELGESKDLRSAERLLTLADLSFLTGPMGPVGWLLHRTLGRSASHLFRAGLPDEFRRLMGWSWSEADDRWYSRVIRVVRVLDRALHPVIRSIYRVYLADLRIRRRLGLRVF